MTISSSGSLEEPVRNVLAKSGLNKSILDGRIAPEAGLQL
jgi:hypothetical protein